MAVFCFSPPSSQRFGWPSTPGWTSCCKRRAAQWPHYLPGSWMPHCTLAMDLAPARLSAAAGLLAGFEKIHAQVVEVGVTDTGDVTVLNR
jgi:hypothetical protein